MVIKDVNPKKLVETADQNFTKMLFFLEADLRQQNKKFLKSKTKSDRKESIV